MLMNIWTRSDRVGVSKLKYFLYYLVISNGGSLSSAVPFSEKVSLTEIILLTPRVGFVANEIFENSPSLSVLIIALPG